MRYGSEFPSQALSYSGKVFPEGERSAPLPSCEYRRRLWPRECNCSSTTSSFSPLRARIDGGWDGWNDDGSNC